MITSETIDRVREAADIVEIIGEHVKLRRAGGDFRGPCPFHGGKNPNFSVSPRRNAYHCFKCGVSGDAIKFVRERLGLDFVEAVKLVAQRSGIEVKEERRGEQAADPREPLWEANAAAAEFFRDTLWIDDEAKVAREYLESRGIDRAASDRFELGYSPRDGARVRAHLNAMGYDDERLLASGLLMQKEGMPEPRARFWGRLMIPILDASGRHVGFGGRVLGEGEPKYLNSAENEIFLKGRLLYGFSGARHAVRKTYRVLVVEGYFDAIRLALGGVEETVAPLGTALTEQQAALLAKLTKNVFLLYDSDAAGLKATFRTGLELLRHGVSARVASLPDGEDPDTFVKKYGAERLEAQLGQAVDIFERQIMELRRRGWFDDLHKRRRAIDKLLPTLRAAADAVTRDLYVARLGEVSGVDRETLLRELAQPDPQQRRPVNPTSGRDDGADPRETVSPPRSQVDGVVFIEQSRRPDEFARNQANARFGQRRRTGRRVEDWASSQAVARVSQSADAVAAERGLVRGMLQDRSQVELVVERWGPEQFHHPLFRRIFERLLSSEDASLVTVTDGLPDADVRVIDELTAEPVPNPATEVDAWLKKLEVLAIDEELNRISARLFDTTQPLLESEKDSLTARKQELVTERSKRSKTRNPFARRVDRP